MKGFTAAALAALAAQAAALDLTILHTNDVHARITSSDEKGELVGGVARRATVINEMRKTKENVLLLDAGDQFQGTVWFNLYKGQEAAHFMNMLGYDAQGLGNHEFDNGSPDLANYLDAIKFPAMACNIDASADPLLKGKIKPYTIVEKGGKKIGIIGYTTEETLYLASPSPETKFAPVAEALPKTVEELKGQGIDIIIAVGHAGYYADMELLKANPDIDIMVGGHTNTFLYMGEPIHNEVPEGPYPEIVERADGHKSLYITDYAFGKYLGHLDVTLDDKGNVVSWEGNPILLSNKTTEKYTATEEDPKVLKEVELWQQNVTALMQEQIGSNMLFLNGDRLQCRQRECNLGNLITDAYVHYFFRMAEAGNIQYKPIISMINGGSIRSNIDVGAVTMGQLMEVMPFENTVVIVHVPGDKLLEAVEHGVGSVEKGEGRFPQVSGLQFTFDVGRPSGSRVIELNVPCLSCPFPELMPVDPAETYPVIMSSYSSEGGDGYSMFAGLPRDDYEILDTDPILEYIKSFSPLHATDQGRIVRLNSTETGGAPADASNAEATAPAESESSSSGGSNTGLIIGIVVAAIVGVVLGGGIVGFYMRSKINKKSNAESAVTLS